MLLDGYFVEWRRYLRGLLHLPFDLNRGISSFRSLSKMSICNQQEALQQQCFVRENSAEDVMKYDR